MAQLLIVGCSRQIDDAVQGLCQARYRYIVEEACPREGACKDARRGRAKRR
jgi:hypothetical protein